jgi:tetratricopeptide (TPR) repeat protein
MNLSKYRQVFLSQRQRTLEQYSKLRVKVDDYQKTVYTTWKMCYDLLGQDSQPMLWLITFLHHNTITENIFQRAATNMHSYMPLLPPTEVEAAALAYVQKYLGTFLDSDGQWDSLRFSEVMSDISSYSLIDFDRMNEAYSVHVLVQDWSHTVIPQTPELAVECTATLLSLSIDDDDVAESRMFRRVLGLHVSNVLSKLKGQIGGNHADCFAKVYHEVGQWRYEETMYVQVRDARMQVLGEEHPCTLISMNGLAITYSNQGRWAEAESLHVQVLNVRKRVLGEEHPSTLMSMSNLAMAYSDQGRWEEAESLHVQVLNVRKRVLGEEHPHTLTSMNNLATAYSYQSRWHQAESLQVQVLNVQKRVLGEEHPDTLSSMNNLATAYSDQGRWEEAKSLLVQVLNVQKRVLGEEHPDTLSSMNNLAMAYLNLGLLDWADLLLTQAVHISKRTLGAQHPNTLKRERNLNYLKSHRLPDSNSPL